MPSTWRQGTPAGCRDVILLRLPFDKHPTGGVEFGRCGDTFVSNIAEHTSAVPSDIHVGDFVEEVAGVRCRDVPLAELEHLMRDSLAGRDGQVRLKLRSDRRIVIPRSVDEQKNCLRARSRLFKSRKAMRSMSKMTPMEPSGHGIEIKLRLEDDVIIPTPDRRTEIKKCNLDMRPEPRRDSRPPSPPRKDGATNTEFTASYVFRAEEFKALLKSQKKRDTRQEGIFAKQVQAFNRMGISDDWKRHRNWRNKGHGKATKHLKASESDRGESKGFYSPPHETCLKSALSCLERALNPSGDSERNSK
ncbi:uncharacterized protein LOC100906963 [Galendromus occidentalis]|uniref:Uncharacterized protein LOC100906963 n=1 Tax=Galendromus occidentalis TaxID=34638 RepID=A0AAJ7L629_9ACAR|nr:uncharacterized protein LOC100906963 [Galendromus occidentalis]